MNNQIDWNKIDLNASIKPYHSAGGFKLGTMISEISKQILSQFELKEIRNKYLPDHPPIIEFRTNDLILHFYEERLTQIGVTGEYAGKLPPNLGINSIVNEFEKHYGEFTEGNEDELKFANLNGLCFEVNHKLYNSENWCQVIPSLPVTEIYIFGKDIYI